MKKTCATTDCRDDDTQQPVQHKSERTAWKADGKMQMD